MRTVFSIGLLAVLLLLGWVAPAQVPPPAPAAGAVTYQTFYDALSPYGQWVSDPDYGYVWVPAAEADFQPYRSNGHWVYTDYGWTWVSDYAWGWAPFHYGRWRYAESVGGWAWVPGYSWGPAWVAWRQSAGYYGWAPLGPPPARPGVRVSIGLSFSFGDAPVAPARWCFVPAAYVASPRLATYYVPPARTTVVYNQTTIIHNTYVNQQVNMRQVTNSTTIVGNGGRRGGGGFPAGPARADVEKATGQPIQQLNVASRSTPGVGVQGRSLAFYRPRVAAPGSAGSAAPAPPRVVSAEAARQGRVARSGPDGLVRGKAFQQLNSTNPHPFRDAQAAAAASQPAAGGATPGTPVPARRNRPDNLPPPNAASTSTDALPTAGQLDRQQRQQARLSQQPPAGQQPLDPAGSSTQQLRQQQRFQNQQQQDRQRQREQNQQIRQQQQQAREQNQQIRQQQLRTQQEPRAMRPQLREGGREERRR